MSEEEVIEVTIDMTELKKMKVPDLKKKVAELGLPTKGTKAELLARVEKYIHEQEDLLVEEEEVEEEEEEVEEVGEEEEEGVEEEEGGVDEGVGQQGGQEEEGVASASAGEQKQQQVKEKVAAGGNASQGGTTTEQPKDVESVPAVSKIMTKVSTNQADRLAQRAARFGGNSSDDAKKMARAERFGTTLENGYQGLGKRGPLSEAELEKMKKRQERFGVAVSPAITNLEDVEKKKKRLERFGQNVTELAVEERKKARAARFSNS